MALQRRHNTIMETGDPLLPNGGGQEGDHDRASRATGWKSEWRSITLLVFLYLLQGVPLGMGSAFIMFLQNRKISYAQQALFSFVTWPFSMKFLWAPIVDSLHVRTFGRRKSWLIPVQYMIGIFLLVLSSQLDSWFSDEKHAPNVHVLTIVFFALNFFAATQDIAVDGWALTMLSRRNVGHASTCNSVGQTAGYFLGHVLFLTLESKEFANRFVYSSPQPAGLVTMAGFLQFWAWVFIITTTLLGIFKHEEELHEDDQMGVLETYKLAKKILLRPSVISIAIFLLTGRIGFGITDGVTALKLIEAGVPKENLALLSIPMTPLQILLPLVIAPYVTGNRPLDVFIKAYPLRLLFGLVLAAAVNWASSFGGEFPLYFYVIIVIIYALHQVLVYSCFVAQMAFFAKISDPTMGGTYMTLLNTLANLGGNWPATLSIWLLDYTTRKTCVPLGSDCSGNSAEKQCKAAGGSCDTTLDGYYVETIISVIIGFVWLVVFGKHTANRLQRLKPADWAVRS